ncbi:biotin--[acetyl-CoA-carboxylase] ligase [Fulvivirga ligni]|uniref:biotin--[acetyl-CoA-carboxylase] ligase n=1 Tax=Fulvivirga ligni TaxID=2904246 RepID=UPI001F32B9F4|nr:biotin--[acetyl-CoA-carboxylase] ligase [Fulvivirga ligni]UII21253.1 biotin--[acetyl-CoA-carboxylase] ligase [Fulvivirga ligni]
MGKNLIFLPSCHSTNEEAQQMLGSGVMEGTIIITENQTRGKGQRGNSWEAEPGKNLTFSFILKPSFLGVQSQFELNRVVSLGIHDYLSDMAPGFQVKWPNDIYNLDKKICGILIQNSVKKNHIENSIVGIGLNINQRKFSNERAISLGQITDESYDLQQVLDNLMQHIESRYLMLKNGRKEQLKTDYESTLYRFGEECLYKSNDQVFTGKITSVTPVGQLEIETLQGMRYFDFKEVEFLH